MRLPINKCTAPTLLTCTVSLQPHALSPLLTGPFNSWDRQVYLFLGDDSQPTVVKRIDNIERNVIIANYHS